MIIRSILTIAVLASFVFGAAANAGQIRTDTRGLTAQIDGVAAPSPDRISGFASYGGLGTTG
jgi:hypothetical protein